MGSMSATIEVTTTQPSQLEQMAQAVFQNLKALREAHRNQILAGAGLAAPTTPSSQASGTGNTSWHINQTALTFLLGGTFKEKTAVNDVDVPTGSFLTGFTTGKSCVAALVMYLSSGTPTLAAVKGTPATTGSQRAPLDSDIQTQLGAGVAWIKIGETTLNRTGDATVTQTYNNAARPLLGITVCPDMGNY